MTNHQYNTPRRQTFGYLLRRGEH